MSKIHIHMMWALNALTNENNLRLRHTFEPISYKAVRNSSDGAEGKKVMKTEIAFHIKNGIGILQSRFIDRMIIIDRGVFKLKFDLDDRILRFKARGMMHGYKQKKEIDYTTTGAEIVKSASFRTLFAIAAEKRLNIKQMNIVTAFLYDLLNEEVYVIQSNDFMKNPDLMCRLIKALYELKQASRVGYEIIRKFFNELGFESTEADHSVFAFKNKKTFIAVYVDDLLIFCSDMAFIDVIKKKLSQRFKMTDLNVVQHYLGMEVIRIDDSIMLR